MLHAQFDIVKKGLQLTLSKTMDDTKKNSCLKQSLWLTNKSLKPGYNSIPNDERDTLASKFDCSRRGWCVCLAVSIIFFPLYGMLSCSGVHEMVSF